MATSVATSSRSRAVSRAQSTTRGDASTPWTQYSAPYVVRNSSPECESRQGFSICQDGAPAAESGGADANSPDAPAARAVAAADDVSELTAPGEAEAEAEAEGEGEGEGEAEGEDEMED